MTQLDEKIDALEKEAQRLRAERLRLKPGPQSGTTKRD
jgi:uncharacterized small protein (DUF1192 family)